jgi:TetR/AcrR family transcriptional regulator
MRVMEASSPRALAKTPRQVGTQLRSRTRNPELTRQKLLDAATLEFAARGLEGARVDQIARRAGANKQLVYHYFGNKDQLYTAVLEDSYTRFRAREQVLTAGRLAPAEAISKLVNVLFDSFLALPEVVSLIADENIHRARHVRGSSKIKALHSHLLSLIGRIIEDGEQQGVFRKGIDPLRLIISILGLCNIYVSNNHTLSAVYGRDLSQSREAERWRAHIVDFVSHALRR